MSVNSVKGNVIPGLRYKDAVAMIEWLCRAFGFEKNAVYMGSGETVSHAQLTLGGGMVMIGSVENGSGASVLMVQPSEVGGRETQAPYLVVEDCDAAYARAKAEGAEIVMELEEKGYGGKGFACRDPEGHVWHVGSYDPWA
jgi:uncharacterized glyoxalase superfamily protein PhnB